MPELELERYWFEYWQAVGYSLSGINGVEPLTASELRDFSLSTNRALNRWEFETILLMSRAYCSSYNRSKKKDEPPPFGNPIQEFDRSRVARDIKGKFADFLKGSRRK